MNMLYYIPMARHCGGKYYFKLKFHEFEMFYIIGEYNTFQ